MSALPTDEVAAPRLWLTRHPLWLKALVYGVLYFAAAELGNLLSVQKTFSTVWPAAGLAVGVLLLCDRKEWPVLLLAGALGNLASDLNHDRSLTMALGFALANVSETLLAAWLVRRALGSKPQLVALHQVMVLGGVGALLSPMLGATLGTLTVHLAVGSENPFTVWYTWWIGDVLGIMIVAPLVLVAGGWMRRESRSRLAQPAGALRLLELTALMVALALASWLIFNAHRDGQVWKYLLVPLLVWAGLRFGIAACAGAAALVTVVGVASLSTSATQVALATGQTALLVLQMQLFMAVAGFTSLALAALVEQNRETAEAANITAEKYRVLFEAVPMGITVSDPDGAIIESSRFAEGILGISSEEQRSRSIDDAKWEIIHPDGSPYDPEEYGTVRALRTNAVAYDHDMGIVSELGVRWIDVTTIPLDLEGYGVIAAYADVTERHEAQADLARYKENLEELVSARTAELERANEELREASSAKNRFLASMSHELRTPLNAIIGFSGVLKQGLAGELTEEQAKQVGMIKDSGDHLLTMVNDILDLSRIEEGHVKVGISSFALADLIETVAQSTRPAALAKGLEFITSVPDGAGEIVTDRDKVFQILVNLVDNAIKFTASGSITLSADVDGSILRLQVADTGIGISDEDLPRVMEEFSQVEAVGGMKPPGTGLGLAITSRLAMLLGGDLSVWSEPGVGSTFTVEIPLAQEPSVG